VLTLRTTGSFRGVRRGREIWNRNTAKNNKLATQTTKNRTIMTSLPMRVVPHGSGNPIGALH